MSFGEKIQVTHPFNLPKHQPTGKPWVMGNNGVMNLDHAEREVSDVALLTGPSAGDMLAAAIGSQGRILSWQVHSVHHRPGAGVTVGYTVQVDAQISHVAGPGRAVDEYMCATTAALTDPGAPNLVRIDGPGGIVVHVWRHPDDPELPGLATACDSAALSARLNSRVSLELLSYRPTRRAVVRATYQSGERAYAKVVRPSHAHSLVKRHVMLTEAGVPAPEVLLSDPSGLVLISEGVGEPLANLLASGMGERTDQVLHALVHTLDKFPAKAAELTRRPSWSERSEHYAHAAATVLPKHKERLDALARGIQHLMANSDPGPIIATHGDFYEANILMDRQTAQVSAIIDVDSLGPGYRVDDLACLLGHISVLPYLAPSIYQNVPEELDRWVSLCERMVDPVALMARCAGVTLSLVAGARREDGSEWMSDAEGRLAAAELWLARGRTHLARRIRIDSGN